MDIESKVDVITRGLVEVVTVGDLKERLASKSKLKAYLGFEPSGLVHVGWLVWMLKVKELVSVGVEFNVLEATWHAMINDKLGGDLELIRKAAKIVEVVMDSLGIGPGRVNFIDAEELVSDKDYWGLLIRIAKNSTLARVKRALTIMGRRAEEAELDFSKLIYPLMQVADIFYLGVDLALGGMDQRKAHMLARDVAKKLGVEKPIALHTPIISSLTGVSRMEGLETDELLAEYKMSKSKPETAIFLHDSPEKIKWKIRRAYCPPRQVEFNPIIEINKYVLFRIPGFKLVVERPPKYGGTVEYDKYEDLEADYVEGRLHPLDLKNATAEALAMVLKPIRDRLMSDSSIAGVISEIEAGKVTR